MPYVTELPAMREARETLAITSSEDALPLPRPNSSHLPQPLAGPEIEGGSAITLGLRCLDTANLPSMFRMP
jgi:hypothetical protein